MQHRDVFGQGLNIPNTMHQRIVHVLANSSRSF